MILTIYLRFLAKKGYTTVTWWLGRVSINHLTSDPPQHASSQLAPTGTLSSGPEKNVCFICTNIAQTIDRAVLPDSVATMH